MILTIMANGCRLMDEGLAEWEMPNKTKVL
jgi:hypothetical protein